MSATSITHEMFDRVRNRDYSWARLISDVFSPPVVWAFMVFPVAFKYAETASSAWMWSLLYVGLLCAAPVAYIAVMVRMGRISDIHIENRNERLLPYLFTLLCALFGWWLMRALGAPAVLPLLLIFSMIQILVMALITLVWQISMHAMSIAGAVVALTIIFGTSYAVISLPLIVIVGAARIDMKRHTVMQVVAGTLLGALLPIAVVFLLAL